MFRLVFILWFVSGNYWTVFHETWMEDWSRSQNVDSRNISSLYLTRIRVASIYEQIQFDVDPNKNLLFSSNKIRDYDSICIVRGLVILNHGKFKFRVMELECAPFQFHVAFIIQVLGALWRRTSCPFTVTSVGCIATTLQASGRRASAKEKPRFPAGRRNIQTSWRSTDL